ncbi:hypothetical protein [Halomonas dongshanensis]|uniref:DUF4136 domain-containing protein n=1 Tax=Halomonas dongshanensis TaxID=2890835 RepID=A0ABT2EIJ4_9GAMM|nr:hypothetical protein [Halomonas dongshanensis]MCS2610417.1 hypothetical protein [Halomonas dongshanensis]
MKKILLSTSVAALLTGCAAPSIQAPYDPGRNYIETYNGEFSQVWEATVDWFATNNIPIKNIEKASGIIGSDYALGASHSQIDCGAIDVGSMYVLRDVNATANLNVLVREQAGRVSVQPNIFGNASYTLQSTWDGSLAVVKPDRCISTGELERSLHQYLSSRF